MKIIILVLLAVIYFSHFVHTGNILLLEEVPSPSHHLWFKTITTELAAKGHNITVVSGDADTSTDNIHYIHMDKAYESFYTVDDDGDRDFFDMGSQSFFSQILDGVKFSLRICNGFLKSAGWEQLHKYPDDFKFDLIIHDYVVGGCLLNFLQKFSNVPLISMTAFNDNHMHPFAAQSSLAPALNPYPLFKTFPVTFKERVSNVLLHLADKIIYFCYWSQKQTSLVQSVSNFDSTLSSVSGLSRKSILYLTNYDAAVNGPQQMSPNVIGVGGLQIKNPQPLAEDLQIIVDSATDGLVLFSLGTNVRSELLGDDVISDILQVFGQFPNHGFLWKIDMEKFPVPLPRNVFVRSFIPQNDILAQNNTKLFITHAGLLSTQESIWHGVPMLGVPIFADQFSNIHRCVDKGIAEFLYFDNLTKENLYNKLKLMLTNPKYLENIQITSKAFQDQKETPLQRAIWWIEWAMRNPKVNHFKSNGEHLNFLQIESIDVYAFLTIVFTTITWIQLWIAYKIVRCFFFRKTVNSSKSSKPVSGKKKRN